MAACLLLSLPVCLRLVTLCLRMKLSLQHWPLSCLLVVSWGWDMEKPEEPSLSPTPSSQGRGSTDAAQEPCTRVGAGVGYQLFP